MFNLSALKYSPSSHIVAIDLGSNSFHMIVAHWENGQIRLLDKLREPVQLGFGLQEDGSLAEDARDRALQCLERFGECLRGYPSKNVRIVGTKTLRSLKNSKDFLAAAQNLLGYPVEIISGNEEARLIYLGVAQGVAPVKGKRLVMDIGGGSTEVILGKGMKPLLKESLNMGCVAITKRFFADGKVNQRNVTKAMVACLQEVEPIKDDFFAHEWQEVLGASGTIKTIAKVCRQQTWSDGVIRLEHLEKIIGFYLQHGNIHAPYLDLSEERRKVFLGGAIVLNALFQSFAFKEVNAVDWALREGLLFDLKGRMENYDIRQSSVDALALRFHVNQEKALAVEKTALLLLKQVSGIWYLAEGDASKLLSWAARLYQIGLDISHNDYHKHGAYVVQHVDLAGCSRAEQEQLSVLILAHRKRFPVKHFPLHNLDLVHLVILLRMAVIFHRSRLRDSNPAIKLQVDDNHLILKLSHKWLENHPLTLADLENERDYLQEIGYRLDIETN
jgi:exopolyphosphatase / guanosine-5'-triphosphate,3'-diphosphate pyrophosphatase